MRTMWHGFFLHWLCWFYGFISITCWCCAGIEDMREIVRWTNCCSNSWGNLNKLRTLFFLCKIQIHMEFMNTLNSKSCTWKANLLHWLMWTTGWQLCAMREACVCGIVLKLSDKSAQNAYADFLPNPHALRMQWFPSSNVSELNGRLVKLIVVNNALMIMRACSSPHLWYR